jgi:flavin-dependent dehydrogenase
MKAWDVTVVGAGPAGAVAAYRLARRGLSVLLLDQAHFPRPKACGGCLNRAVLAALNAVGLGHVPAECGALPFLRARIATGPKHSADVALPGGLAVSREAFDAELVNEARRAGVTVRTGVRAAVDPMGVRLTNGETVPARVAIVATGLAGNTGPAAAGSRVGVGAVISADGAPDGFEVGTIHLAVARFGYVGAVRVEGDRLDVAAAFDPGFIRSRGGPGPACGGSRSATRPGTSSRSPAKESRGRFNRRSPSPRSRSGPSQLGMIAWSKNGIELTTD